LKVLIISQKQEQAIQIKEKVASLPITPIVLEYEEVKKEISRLYPQIILLYEPKDENYLSLLPYLQKELPLGKVIYLMEKRDPIKSRDAHRAGVLDVLFLPEELEVLPEIIERAMESVRSGESSERVGKRGQIISVFSGKGGSGKSLLSAVLGQTLSLEWSQKVLLIDLNLQYGGVETYLQMEIGRNLSDLTPVLEELNDVHIRNVTTVEPYSHLEVITSPTEMEQVNQITEYHVERILRSARLSYDMVIVDLPSHLNLLSYTALEEADQILYLLEPEISSLQILGKVLQQFQTVKIDPVDRFSLVLNPVSTFQDFRRTEVKEYFSFPIRAELREDRKGIQYLINRGKMIRTTKRDRNMTLYARDVQKLALNLMKQTQGGDK
jgi:pilus assembly protein CpaE